MKGARGVNGKREVFAGVLAFVRADPPAFFLTEVALVLSLRGGVIGLGCVVFFIGIPFLTCGEGL